ncbi:MAG: recombination protein RecR [Gammaproteobacteria bacterium]|nr:recombination protein RecR [Gammaproteobacteria bacterium]
MSSSPALDALIDALKCLPGVGQKSAQRMALHLVERDQAGARQLANATLDALEKVSHCERCRNFADTEICQICTDQKRDNSLLCIVETPADVLAIEASGAYRGLYFVLCGRLSPLDGCGPEELGLDALETGFKQGDVNEVILATSATVEGDITAQFIADIATRYELSVSRLARGIPLGGELEYVDSGTLSRAVSGRQQYQS